MKEFKDNFKNIFSNNYANFKGRADRSELWLFNAALYIIFMIVYMLMYPFIIMVSFASALSGANAHNQTSVVGMLAIYAVFFIIMVPFFIPSLALGVRRLHDTNRSGWYLLLNLIPFIGGIILTILLAIDGDRGTNQYGEDPKIKKYSQVY